MCAGRASLKLRGCLRVQLLACSNQLQHAGTGFITHIMLALTHVFQGFQATVSPNVGASSLWWSACCKTLLSGLQFGLLCTPVGLVLKDGSMAAGDVCFQWCHSCHPSAGQRLQSLAWCTAAQYSRQPHAQACVAERLAGTCSC